MPTVVVVDDAADVRLLMKTRLRVSGSFKVVGEGADGAQAVALAEQHEPALMLLDVSMPGVDGLQALPEVLKVSPSTRVVMFSGFEEHGLAERARALGAADFIEKSVPVDALLARLLELLERPTAARRQSSGAVVSVDQEVLDEHLERFREVFEEAAIGMATMTLTGRVVRANRALASLVERPAPEMVGMPYAELTDHGAELVAGALRDIRERAVDVIQLEHGVRAATDHRPVR